MASKEKIGVKPLAASASLDEGLVDHLTRLVNEVYATAERGLWHDGATRTTVGEVSGLIAAEQIVVACLHGDVVGAVRAQDLAEDVGEFGMLAAAHEHRSLGVGRALVDHVERRASERGRRAMQLELLVPRDWLHPSKEFLKSWYGRRGYRVVRTGRLDDLYPDLAPSLATPCDLLFYEKPLSRSWP